MTVIGRERKKVRRTSFNEEEVKDGAESEAKVKDALSATPAASGTLQP